MSSAPSSITVSADTPAVVVPSGESITIPAGSLVQITHRLGGNLTVTWEFGMARISGIYANNFGEAVPDWAKNQKKSDNKDEDTSGSIPTEAMVWEALKNVFDPEIPINIVDLGLIYSMELKEVDPTQKQLGYHVNVKMTLTAPGCGMGPSIAADAKSRIEQIPGVTQALAEIVWDPPWNQGMISEEGRMQLGLV